MQKGPGLLVRGGESQQRGKDRLSTASGMPATSFQPRNVRGRRTFNMGKTGTPFNRRVNGIK